MDTISTNSRGISERQASEIKKNLPTSDQLAYQLIDAIINQSK